MSQLLTPLKKGVYSFKNRVVMASLTRQRANPEDGIPTPLHASYYSSRAQSGTALLLTEASPVNPAAHSNPGCCGIFTKEQTEGWKRVVDAVHKTRDCLFFHQIWHAGRAAHPFNIGGREPIGPSAIAIPGNVFTPQGFVPHVTPKEATLDDIK